MAPKKKPVTRKTPRNTKTTAKSLMVVSEPVAEIVTLPLIQEPIITTVTIIPDTEIKIYKQPALLLVIALFIGWTFDFLFWERSVGVNFSVFMSLCLLGGFSWLIANGLKPSRKSLWLLAPFLFFAVVTFVRQEPLTIFLAFTFTLLSIGLFGSSYLGGRWFQYGLLDYLYKFFLLIGDMLAGAVGYISKARRIQENSDSSKNGFPIWGLVRGLLFALPILICFGSLLAAGDLVFKEKLDDFFDFDDLSENIFRGILILFYAYILVGVFIHAALRSKDESLVGENKPVIKPFVGFAESTVILGSVSVLFLAFVIVQFRYFFGGETNIGVEGYTYSQYARRGFNELVIVAFFSLVLILGLSTVTRRETEIQRKIYSWLSVVLVGLVLIILVSAYHRISLAIGWHGYSRLRLYPRIFLIWLGLLLITVVFLEIVRKERYFGFAAVLASVGFVVSLTLFNVDAATVRHNVYRAWHGQYMNVSHLASLSMDAVPELAEEFLSSDLPPFTREGVGGILACYRYKETRSHVSENDWRSFNYSKWQAHKALDEVRPYLAGYIIRYRNGPVRVRTPSGYLFDCTYYGGSEEE